MMPLLSLLRPCQLNPAAPVLQLASKEMPKMIVDIFKKKGSFLSEIREFMNLMKKGNFLYVIEEIRSFPVIFFKSLYLF